MLYFKDATRNGTRVLSKAGVYLGSVRYGLLYECINTPAHADELKALGFTSKMPEWIAGDAGLRKHAERHAANTGVHRDVLAPRRERDAKAAKAEAKKAPKE